MKRIAKYPINWLKNKFLSVMINTSIALKNSDDDVFKVDPNLIDEKDKKIQRKRHRNQSLEKMYVGEKDEKYVQQFYEILRKADKFMKNSRPDDIAMVADRFRMSMGTKNDKYIEVERGVRKEEMYNEHFGFYDPKHKNYGKSIAEVEMEEINQRKTNDDDYEVIYIFNNEPIEDGFDVLTFDENIEKYVSPSILERAKSRKFPLFVVRENEVVNKIEQLTSYLHVKKIGMEYRMLEFFIPKKFKVQELDQSSDIFNQLITLQTVWFKDKYGELFGFKINKFEKIVDYSSVYIVLKFIALEIENKNPNL